MTYEIFTLTLTLTLSLSLSLSLSLAPSLAQATKLVTYEIFARSCTRAAAALERRLIPGSEGTLPPISHPHLPYISPISPPCLRYTSPISPYISPIGL